MPSLSSVWNLEPPPAPAPPASSSSSSSLPSSSSSPTSTSPRQSSFHDIEKHPSTTTHSYPSVHRTGLSWSGSTSSLHVGNLGGRGAVKRLAFVLAIVSLGLWLVVKSGGSEVASGWTAGRSGSSSSRGKGHVQSTSPWSHPSGLREIDAASDDLPLTATTAERLAVWENAPGGRGEIEGEVELGGFYAWNKEQCANIWPNQNKDLIFKAADTWNALNRSSIHDVRMELIDHMRAADRAGKMNKYGKGRGIVFTAGNADTIERCIYTLRVLRRVYHSTLPAEIYHFPSERPDPDSKQLVELAELGAKMVEAPGEKKDAKKTKNYHLKALAIIMSPFREVLFLDSDNIPVRDPSYLFDAPPYKRLGAMFWPDYWKTNPGNPIWQILGVKCRNEWEQEAGQMLFDKARHLDALVLSEHMLQNTAFWYMFSDGDKDIFRFSFLALRKRWAVPGRYVGVAALPYGTASGDFCGLTMQQYDHMGEPAFIHYNLLKQVPSGVGRGFSWGRTKQYPLFVDGAHPPPGANETRDGEVRGLGDVDCDMLADADDAGHARREASVEVRKRAAWERGGRPFFHGGQTSALCIDIKTDDPRPDSSRAADERLIDAARLKANVPEGDEFQFDKATLSPLGIRWDQDPLEIVQWSDDERLRDFEAQVYDQGFVPNGSGF